ncbi:hypothetical protein MVES_003375 [Malassezia vespertilionis]|uniref:Ataxin-10 homolog n=2 Tax=Malassezia vespertilionis TaxID=2020962 RepID=A0A2N1J7K7_9BASI|nr:hypothetical protein MVES_003375 [Malassezia vespertilionis]
MHTPTNTAQFCSEAKTFSAELARAAPPSGQSEAIFAWLAAAVDRWIAYDSAYSKDAPPFELERRKLAAQEMCSILEIARNCACKPDAARSILASWDTIHALLGYALVFQHMSDPLLIPVIRVLAQFLANAATSDEALREHVWRTHIVPCKAGSNGDAIARLLTSTDIHTMLAIQVLILNTLSSNPAFSENLVQTEQGRKIIELLLQLYEATLLDDALYEESLGAQGKCLAESLDVTCAIVQRFLERGNVGSLLAALAPQETMEPNVSPSQITLLHVMRECFQDQLGVIQRDKVSQAAMTEATVPLYLHVAQYGIKIMTQHVESKVDDFRGLVRAHMALLAVLQLLNTAAMCGQEDVGKVGTSALLAQLRCAESGVVTTSLALLCAANQFFPAQSPLKKQDAQVPLPPGHVFAGAGYADVHDDRPALHSLKRSILQLIATLAFHPPGMQVLDEVKLVQDTVREQGGLLDVLNLTVLDENNPYIREHAVFALRNLLANNQASQAQITALRPAQE